jgi:hypothetical protein
MERSRSTGELFELNNNNLVSYDCSPDVMLTINKSEQCSRHSLPVESALIAYTTTLPRKPLPPNAPLPQTRVAFLELAGRASSSSDLLDGGFSKEQARARMMKMAAEKLIASEMNMQAARRISQSFSMSQLPTVRSSKFSARERLARLFSRKKPMAHGAHAVVSAPVLISSTVSALPLVDVIVEEDGRPENVRDAPKIIPNFNLF